MAWCVFLFLFYVCIVCEFVFLSLEMPWLFGGWVPGCLGGIEYISVGVWFRSCLSIFIAVMVLPVAG